MAVNPTPRAWRSTPWHCRRLIHRGRARRWTLLRRSPMPRIPPDSVWALSLVAVCVSAPVAHAGAKASAIVPERLPAVMEVEPHEILSRLDGTRIHRGGYGSALAIDQHHGV